MLTSVIDSTIAFTVAFSLEALLFSGELWAKLPVGLVLLMIVFLLYWCVSVVEARSSFSVLESVRIFKVLLVDIARSLRG